MKKQPLYTTDKGQIKRPQRRRIGQPSRELIKELKGLTAYEIASVKITTALMLLNI